MKHVLIICFALLLSSCAALHRPDGTVNTSVILADARWGVLQACDELWLSTEQCAFASNLLSLADSIAAPNLKGSEVAVRGLIVQWEAKLPVESRLRPYLDAVIALLPAT